MAIAIADSWQHRGLGHAMLARAILWAQAHGVAKLIASIRSSNGSMLGLIRSMTLPVTFINTDGGVLEAVLDVRVRVPHAA